MAKNNLPGVVKCAKVETVQLHAKLQGAGAAVLVKAEPFAMGSAILSISRGGVGTHSFVFTDTFPQLIGGAAPLIVGTTAGLMARFSAIDVAAGTATLVTSVGAVATDLAATDFIYLDLLVRNSGQT